MKINELRPGRGANRPRKRIGRGIGSGHGVTATKGTKGQKARAGAHMIPGFEGGQIRMVKRLPHKRGFNNAWRVEYEVFNVGFLAGRFAAGEEVDIAAFERTGLRTKKLPIKILGDGQLSVALTVTAHKVSKSAREKIEGAGGTVNELGVKDVHGKKHDVDAADVTIRSGEKPRVVDVKKVRREAKARRRGDAPAAEAVVEPGGQEA